jgi:hypothetical protein
VPGAAEDLDIIVGLSYSVGAGAGAIVRAIEGRVRRRRIEGASTHGAVLLRRHQCAHLLMQPTRFGIRGQQQA